MLRLGYNYLYGFSLEVVYIFNDFGFKWIIAETRFH
jgi:hypothetical protein